MKSRKRRDRNALPVRAVCRNCGTATVGRYCHICGQEITAGTNHRMREIVGVSFDTILAWDNKVFTTLWYLIAFPGRLTTEFYAGRIVRYVFPAKLFWFISIVFFALTLSGIDFDGESEGETPKEDAVVEAVVAELADASVTKETVAGEVESVTKETVAEEVAEDGKLLTDIAGVTIRGDVEEGEEGEGAKFSVRFDNAISDLDSSDMRQVQDFFVAWAPYFALLLVPVFALLVMLFFWRREHAYSHYLVFSLHYNSFVFLMLTLMTVMLKIFPDEKVSDALTPWFAFWLPVIYLGFALRRVFRPRVGSMIFRIFMMGFLYFLMLLVMAVIFIVIFVIINKTDIFAGN
ncbi:MAG: DUF3667 domain-containing protein [Alistipes sp.]|jgi:hypothetical protein|nr:DUF3667 domain-containing protein [Alistipes sp.]